MDYDNWRGRAVTRTVNVEAVVVIEQTRRGGGGGRRMSNPNEEVLGASTDTITPAYCPMYLNTYMKKGLDNDSQEVMKLQSFLNEQGISVPQSIFIDYGVALLTVGILFITMFIGQKYTITKTKGILFISLYMVYLILLLVRLQG